jgi:small subunit ribosomal protein S2
MSQTTKESVVPETRENNKDKKDGAGTGVEAIVTMRQLLEAGVHFGHQTKRWDPRMKKFIYTARNDIHVIDLQKTLVLINTAYRVVRDIVGRGGKVLFVGTKKQAQDALKEEAMRCGMYYVSQRWLGGTLTNLDTIRRSVRRLEKIEKMETDGIFDKLPMKEVSALKKEKTKLLFNLEGIRNMKKLPQAIFVVDTLNEAIAVHEANILNIPIIAMVDTNSNPNLVTHPIPSNDDAIRAIKLIANAISRACEEGSKIAIARSQGINEEIVDDYNESIEMAKALEFEETIAQHEALKEIPDKDMDKD